MSIISTSKFGVGNLMYDVHKQDLPMSRKPYPKVYPLGRRASLLNVSVRSLELQSSKL
ncbi:hypothetical protein H1P_430021 [Hyella patelloides LEGE 07179]|uniref:Uncharacterized protein n=1 Tax=Hyella patelloides LEGE 07179 TaxID=945734 RepID=A0A563VYD8_9CYAN|nr:hypothetical protein [Hyella patelloides]VEP16293.1 hypothetical protein H1P_430021 [Hyella patelloides LEGE 07179]